MATLNSRRRKDGRGETEPRQRPNQDLEEELKCTKAGTEAAGSAELILPLLGALFPEGFDRFTAAVREIQKLSIEAERIERERAESRRKHPTSHGSLEAELDARLAIEGWRRKKVEEMHAALAAGSTTQQAVEDEIRAINEVADSRLAAL